MVRNVEALHSLLFEDQQKELVSLALTRGDSLDISEEELCGEIHSALFQVRNGRSVSSRRFSDLVDEGPECDLATLLDG